MIFIALFDFHCTLLMTKFIELNNDNTLTITFKLLNSIFFYFENNIFIIFISFLYQFLSTRKVINFYEYNSIDTLKWSLKFLRLLVIFYFLFFKK